MTTCECGADGKGPCASWCSTRVAKNAASETALIADEEFELHAWPPRPIGGQHVGVQSGVLALHKPTGIGIVERDERSQLRNRERAVARCRAVVQNYLDGRKIVHDVKPAPASVYTHHYGKRKGPR